MADEICLSRQAGAAFKDKLKQVRSSFEDDDRSFVKMGSISGSLKYANMSSSIQQARSGTAETIKRLEVFQREYEIYELTIEEWDRESARLLSNIPEINPEDIEDTWPVELDLTLMASGASNSAYISVADGEARVKVGVWQDPYTGEWYQNFIVCDPVPTIVTSPIDSITLKKDAIEQYKALIKSYAGPADSIGYQLSGKYTPENFTRYLTPVQFDSYSSIIIRGNYSDEQKCRMMLSMALDIDVNDLLAMQDEERLDALKVLMEGWYYSSVASDMDKIALLLGINWFEYSDDYMKEKLSQYFEELVLVGRIVYFPDGKIEKKYSDSELFDILNTHRRRLLDGILDWIGIPQERSVWWQNTTPELYAAKMALEAKLAEKGWTIEYSSAYRPQQYQDHFYDIVTKLSDPSKLTKEELKYYESEKEAHGLGDVVAEYSHHTDGTAFDAKIKDENGKLLNDLSYKSEELEKILLELREAGIKLYLNTEDDYVHFDLSPSAF
jgi:hypothetical protein